MRTRAHSHRAAAKKGENARIYDPIFGYQLFLFTFGIQKLRNCKQVKFGTSDCPKELTNGFLPDGGQHGSLPQAQLDDDGIPTAKHTHS